MTRHRFARIRSFLASETVLVIAAPAALVSMAALPLTPKTAGVYAGYIDMRTIGLLFCLMTVVAGSGRAGLLERVRDWLMGRVGSARSLAFVLMNVVFASSMLVTNDVALITFVPLALALFLGVSPRATIATVVALTVAANLGSMCTPIGNPQNIYLVSAFGMDLGTFFATMLPFGAVSYLACAALVLFVPAEYIATECELGPSPIDRKLLALYLLLFLTCLACVGHLVGWGVCCVAVVAGCLALDRRVFAAVDYSLLATFVCFFVFVENLKHVEPVVTLVGDMIRGRRSWCPRSRARSSATCPPRSCFRDSPTTRVRCSSAPTSGASVRRSPAWRASSRYASTPRCPMFGRVATLPGSPPRTSCYLRFCLLSRRS